MTEDMPKPAPRTGGTPASVIRDPLRWWIAAAPMAAVGGLAAEAFRPGSPWLHGSLALAAAAALCAWGWTRDRRTRSLHRERIGELEARLRLLEEAPVATVLVDANGAVTGVNAAFVSLAGFGAEEVRGRTVASFLHGPGTDPAEAGRFLEAIRSGSEYEGGLLHYGRSGRAFWSQVGLRPVRSVDGALLGFVAMLVEVTQRRRLERDLEMGRQRLAGLVSTVPGVVFELFHSEDGTLGFTFVSEGLRELCGLEPQAILREAGLLLDCIHPEDRTLLEREMRSAEGNGSPWRQVFRLAHLGGGVRSVSVRAVSKPLEGGGHRWTGLFSDVTPEVDRESALLQRQRDLNRLESLARLGSWQRWLGSGKTDWSDTLFGILGLDRESATPGFETFLEHVHPEDRDRFHGAVAEAEVHGTPFEQRFRIVRPDGQVRWVCSRGVLERASSQDPGLMRGTLQDVHESVRREQELASAETRFRLVLEATGDASWDWNPVGGRLVHSARWADMLGCAEAELPSTWEGWLERVHPDDRAVLAAAVEDLCSGFSGCLSAEYRISARDGRWIWMHDRGMAVERDGRGRVARVAGTHSDVTGRKADEARLAESGRLLDEVQRLGRIGTWRQPEGGTPEFSAVAAELFRGPDGAGLDWRSRTAWMEASDRARVESVALGRDDGDGYVVEYRVGGVAGGTWLRETGRRVADPDRGGHRLEGWLQDVGGLHAASEVRRGLGARLRGAQRMEMVGTLAGGIAHDFNNLLTGIQGFVELARTGVAADSEAGGYLRHASDGAGSARELVRRLLAFSRLRPSSSAERLDLGELVRQTSPLLSASLPAHVTLRLELPSGTAPVLGDAVALQQAVVNLCLHSADRLGDAAGEVTLAVDAADSRVTLRVADTAGPWAPGERERIQSGGVGDEASDPRSIAIQVTREIASAHGGTLEAGAGTDGGLRLAVQLPRAAVATETAVVPDAKEPANASAGPLRVAIVDDEPTVRMLLRATLRKLGHEVEAFGDAADVLARLGAGGPAPDLVITDLAMPGMTGAQLLERIRAAGHGVPVVGMSGDAHRFDTARLEALGGYATMGKPFTSTELEAAVALARSRPVVRIPA